MISPDLAPWLALAGLGAFHGLNPAMGWLFSVALGLHRRSAAVVAASLAPIAIGHAASILVVALAAAAFGVFAPRRMLEIGAAVVLLGWAGYHAIYGHRVRTRVGMTVGMTGLAVWSFTMASAHGAGLMLIPIVLPLCLAGTPGGDLLSGASVQIALAAIGVHMAAMLVVTGLIAALVYGWLGVGFLRRGWFNLDRLWSVALVVAALILIF